MTKQKKPFARPDREQGSGTKRRFRLAFELLEDRCLLSAPLWPAWLIAQPSQSQIATLDAAQPLNFSANPGNTASALAAGTDGTIANNSGAGEVNWYSFTLTQASDVQMTTFDVPGRIHLDSVLSLYDTEAQDPYYPLSLAAPPFDPQQHRLLTQIDAASSGSPGYIERELAAGTYYVAVSGHGNEYFNPFLADSGYAGSTGDYSLLVTATPLPIAPTDGPAVLAVDSGLLNGPGLSTAQTSIPILSSSPLALYVDFSSPIDPTTVSLQQSLNDGSSVQLTYNPTGQFGNGNDSAVVLGGFHYAADTMELQLQIVAPLGPGFYQLTLAGNPGTGNQVLTDPSDTINLGQNQNNPVGQDFTTTFQIGSEGSSATTAVSDDTAATARQLGDITQGGVVQAVGAIGDDPAYNPYSASLYLSNPASQVDLYQFQISGSATYDFGAEVFAGRIGSTLDAAISLFRVDANNPQSPLQLVSSNDDSDNQTVSSNGLLVPLYTDPVLNVGLIAGTYYVAVSSSGNMPDNNNNLPGTNGVFDPNVSHSGYNGSTTGSYVLDLLVQPAAPAPHVVSTSPSAGATLSTAPTQMTVTFDSQVNVIALANQSIDGTVSGVFFVEPDGQSVFPRLESYNEATNQATFVMLDRLPDGVNELHLSGADGLTGFGGIPLVGNTPSGDYVVSFAVADPAAPADPLNRTQQASDSASGSVQDLGVLFPIELQSGVTVTGTLSPSAPSGDSYTIQLLESQEYLFTLNGQPQSSGGPLTTLPADVQMTITDATGTAVVPLANGNANAVFASLIPGSYTICISSSSGGITPYEIQITLLNTHENLPPLSVGATPVLQIRSVSNPPPGAPSSPAVPSPISAPVPAMPAPTAPSENVVVGLTLRAELAGGVTDSTSSPLVALAAPLQIQGLSTGPVAVAGSPSPSSANVAILGVLLGAQSISTNELSMADVTQSVGFLLAFWRASLDFLPQRPTSALDYASPQTARAQPEPPLLPQRLQLSSDSSSQANASALPAVVLQRNEGSDLPQPSQGNESRATDANAVAASSVPWVHALCGTILTAVMVWIRTWRKPEADDSN